MSEKNLFLRNGVWWLSVTVRARLYRHSLHTGDLKTARKARDKRIEEIKAVKYRGEILISWQQAVSEWVAHEVGQISPNTAKRYAVSLLQAEPFLSRFTIDTISGNIIAEYISYRRKDGATPATIKRDLTAISRVLDYAEAMGWREGNPTLSKRKLLKERRDPIQLPRHDEIKIMIKNSSPNFGALIKAAALTGCRQNELVMAKWIGFNKEAGTLEVIGKGNKRRVITLSPMAHALICKQDKISEFIFPRADGKPYRMASSDFTHIRRYVRAQMSREGQPFVGFRFHDLRHLFAVEALRSGMSIYDLQKHMGHSSIQVTELYLEFLTPEEHSRAKSQAVAVNYSHNLNHTHSEGRFLN